MRLFPSRLGSLWSLVFLLSSPAYGAYGAHGAGRGPRLEIAPGEAKPGDTLLLTVEGSSTAPVGTAGSDPLHFFAWGKQYRALVALSVDLKPGRLPIRVELPGREKRRALLAGEIALLDPAFPARTLTVDRKFVKPPPKVRKWMAEDRKAFKQLFVRPFSSPRFTHAFSWPRRAAITAHFGDRRLFNGQQKSQHLGTDLDGAVGAPIDAANDGEVVMVRSCYASGNTVVLFHGADLYTLYFHLSEAAVKPGDRVRRGDRLGKVGSTGRVTGPHLHWGVKLAGRYVNAESLLALRF